MSALADRTLRDVYLPCHLKPLAGGRSLLGLAAADRGKQRFRDLDVEGFHDGDVVEKYLGDRREWDRRDIEVSSRTRLSSRSSGPSKTSSKTRSLRASSEAALHSMAASARPPSVSLRLACRRTYRGSKAHSRDHRRRAAETFRRGTTRSTRRRCCRKPDPLR